MKAATHVRPHDVLLNITGASLGRVCAVPADFGDGNVNQHVCIIRPRQAEIRSEYLAAYLSAGFMQHEIYFEQNGASREGLALGAIRSFKIILPPIGEQDQIMQHLRLHTASIIMACQKVEREIDLIREFRTRVIADVVTGKLDVRGLVPANVEVAETELEGLNEGIDVKMPEETDESESALEAADAE